MHNYLLCGAAISGTTPLKEQVMKTLLTNKNIKQFISTSAFMLILNTVIILAK
jgi:hypothetical protein